MLILHNAIELLPTNSDQNLSRIKNNLLFYTSFLIDKTVMVYKVYKKKGYNINYVFRLKNTTVYVSLSGHFCIYVYD